MRAQPDTEYQRGTAADARNAQRLALDDAGRDLHIDRARTAALIQRDAALGAGKRLLHRDLEEAGLHLGFRCPGSTAKKAREEIAETIEIGKALAARLPEALPPIGRRAKLLTRSVVSTELIIGCALVRIAEHFVGLLNLLEFALGVLLLADVGMVFA